MNERQAMEAGLRYTGMSCGRFDDKRRKEYQARAKAIRAYGIRIVQVANSSGWTDWYADEDYSKYCDAAMYKHRLATAEDRKAEALRKYRQALADIEEDVQEANEALGYLKAKYGDLPPSAK